MPTENLPPFTVRYAQRKSLSLHLLPDGQLEVRAPLGFPKEQIALFVAAHLDWIAKQQSRQQAQQALAASVPKLTEAELLKLYAQAKAILPPKVEFWAKAMGVSYGRITIRCQKTRWGSCSASGNLNFNCLLVLAPEAVQDYIVVHELCHRKQMNHSAAFWEAVAQYFPNYKAAKAWLKEHEAALLYKVY